MLLGSGYNHVPELSLTATVQLVLSWLEEDGDGVVVVLGSFEGQVEGEAWSGIASYPAGGVIDTSLAAVHIDQPEFLVSIAERNQ